jgi:hypothetical protein
MVGKHYLGTNSGLLVIREELMPSAETASHKADFSALIARCSELLRDCRQSVQSSFDMCQNAAL